MSRPIVACVLAISMLFFAGCAGEADPAASEGDPTATESQVLTGQERVAGADEEALNVWEWGQASAMLNDAAALIEERGWQQGATGPVQAECITTALENAFYDGETYTVVDFNYAIDVLSEVVGVPSQAEGDPDVPVAVPYWGQHLIAWNDEEGRTEDEVLDALREAASRADDLRQDAVEDDVRLN